MSAPYDKVIAVTGGIGSGKSTVCRLMAEAGAAVVSADETARQIVRPGSKVLEEIARQFGPEFLTGAGELDRTRLGRLVFSVPSERKKLEAITHPEIQKIAKQEFERILQSQRSNGTPPLVFYDCPLYFEAGLERFGFREAVLVDAPDSVCLQRIITRDGLTQEDAERKLKSQIPLSEKRQRATRVIQNDEDITSLRKKVTDYLQTLAIVS